MPKRFTLPRIAGFATALVCTCAILALAAQVAPAKRDDPATPGRILLNITPEDAAGQLPPVAFNHDLHAGGATPEKTCETCHDANAAQNGYPLRETAGKTGKDLENAFHDACFTCHEADAEPPSGPRKAECRSCHNTQALPASTRETGPDADGGMDAALHSRHAASGLLSPAGKDLVPCAVCHHPTNEPLPSGLKADSCRSCHPPEKTGNSPSGAPPFADAAHAQCISCHRALTDSGKASLPVTCVSCHDASVKQTYAKPPLVPRLEAGQPHTAVMTRNGRDAPRPAQATPPDARANAATPAPPVVFDHTAHEARTESCIRCHHDSIRRCASCHTPTGSDAGKGVTLFDAMHAPESDRSCVGCHETRKTASPECAGCHAILPKQEKARPECAFCHTASPRSATAPPGPERRMAKALEAAPENVLIGALSDAYEPVAFPHKKVIRRLADGLGKNLPGGMAHAHAEPYSLCASCHHAGPAAGPPAAGGTPPPCASCHAKSARAASSRDDRPTLKEAYHRQCMTCHTAMDRAKPANADCASCHVRRPDARTGGR